MFNLTRKEKTKVLPLRWFANFCEYAAVFFLRKYAKYNEGTSMAKLYDFISSTLYKPYTRWGSYFVMDSDFLQELIKDTKASLWDDYKDGHPYWDYDWHTNDPLDDWRLVKWNASVEN